MDLTDIEKDVILHALRLFERDLVFDTETFSRSGDLDRLHECVETRSTIQFLYQKIKF